ncbi:MAG: VWA domain-containing protein [Pseudomonadota bacterium]
MKPTAFPGTVSGVSERMTGFMAHLRGNGLFAGVTETQATLQALEQINLVNHHHVRLACKAICTNDHDNFSRFDELFDSYWFNRGREQAGFAVEQQQSQKRKQNTFQPGVDTSHQSSAEGSADHPDDGTSEGNASHNGEGRLIASKTANIEKTDFRELMTPESLQQAEQLAARLANAIRDRRSRRFRADKKGAKVDLRKTIRASISRGGVPLTLHRKRKPDRPVRLVALLDVSGSMTVYAKVFLSFLKGLISHDTHTDAYLFHTALVRISDTLRDHDTLRAVNRLSLMAQGFGGGTKIGANLRRFNQQYAANIVNSRTVVIILSDGYDTDAPQQLGSALQKLKQRGCRIVWLNPLKGWKDYQPVAAGMAAALPWLDHFAAANTLQSLAALEPQLQRL